MAQPSTSTMMTDFLPVERASADQLQAQVQIFARYAYLDDVLSAVPDLMMVLNAQRQVVYANEALLDFAGFDAREDALGLRPGEVIGCVHAFEREGGCGTTVFCRYCGAAQAIQSSWNGNRAVRECHINRTSDEHTPGLDLRVWTTPLSIEGESFTILTLTDMSDEVRRRELESIFFHDLLNTAGIIQTTSDLLMDVCSSDDESPVSKVDQGRAMGDLIQRTAARLVREIQSQKALAQLEREELEIEPERLCTHVLLQDLVVGYRRQEIARGRHLDVDPDSEDVAFFSDPDLLTRVVENMIKNALEAVEPGESVQVGSRWVDGMVEFWVHNPTDMPERVQRQVFKRAFSTKGPGRGLGTYSMRLISERYLNGRVTFTSRPGAGTTFRARYPSSLQNER